KRQPRASHIPTATATAPLLLGKQIKRKVELIAPYTVSHPQIFQTKQDYKPLIGAGYETAVAGLSGGPQGNLVIG
ncbi:MAG TPA: hypothetical protein VKY85_04645, partial [Candidatus Angelobacter sp.]|nr:hypothetical protein [Candidatus Angelobacter sp.]